MADQTIFQQLLVSQADVNQAFPGAPQEFLEDYYRFKQDLFTLAEAVDSLIPAVALSAYGSLSMSGTPVSVSNLSAPFQTISTFSTEQSSPRVTASSATDSVMYPRKGKYIASLSLALSHNSLGSDRQSTIRAYNIDDSTPIGSASVFGTAAGEPSTNILINIVIDIDDSSKGKKIALQIGGGDSYTSVKILSANITTWAVGSYGDAY